MSEDDKGKTREYLLPVDVKVRLYIPEILSDKDLLDKNKCIYIVVGIIKALKLVQEGLPCTALSGILDWRSQDENGKNQVLPDLLKYCFPGRELRVVFDSDVTKAPCLASSEFLIGRGLKREGCNVSGIRLPPGKNGENVGVDDFLITHTVDDLTNLPCVPLDGSPITWSEQWIYEYQNSKTKTKPNFKIIIIPLKNLTIPQYESVRIRVSKILGYRVEILDSEVAKNRPTKEKAHDRIFFKDPSPHETLVDGYELLVKISDWLKQYLDIKPDFAVAIAGWAIATWLREELFFAPLLTVLSPSKRCGKTNLLDMVSWIAYRGYSTSGGGISYAGLFRINDKYHTTILIDEAEKLASNKEAGDLIGLLNSGVRQGSRYIRCGGDNYDPIQYDSFGFRTVAAIGTLWPTILDRSIIIKMERKKKGVKVDRFEVQKVQKEGAVLSKMIARWVQDHRAEIKEGLSNTPRPKWLNDRSCDNWSSLFVIGEVSGDKRLNSLLLRTAKRLSSSNIESEDQGEVLLRDIKAIFKKSNITYISSQQITEDLNKIETSEWSEEKSGRGITPAKLASRLKPFNIAPQHTINGNGYYLKQFKDAFPRYISD